MDNGETLTMLEDHIPDDEWPPARVKIECKDCGEIVLDTVRDSFPADRQIAEWKMETKAGIHARVHDHWDMDVDVELPPEVQEVNIDVTVGRNESD